MSHQNSIKSIHPRPSATRKHKPDWLKVRYTVNEDFKALRGIVRKYNLHTVCEEARCPNQGECWRRRTATLMILGDRCTRDCRFCAVNNGRPLPPDPTEPQKVAQAVTRMGLKYAVITSVTRDDLPDGGAAPWAETITEIRRQNPACKIEVLIPDFMGKPQALDTVINARPDVIGHNLETVRRLYSSARPQADYDRSLQVLQSASQWGAVVKTGIMLGLGETRAEIRELMEDACTAGCVIFTAGQYLQPTRNHLPVDRYISPKEFRSIESDARKLGFRSVLAGPLVRSSYHAEELMVNHS